MPSSCGKRANCLGEIVMDYGKTVKIAALCMFTLIMFGACAPYKTSETEEIKTDRRIHLCVGDSYDFYAMGYIVDETDKSILSQNGDVVRAEMKGKGLVRVTDMKTGAPAVIEVNAYSTSAELGDRFSVDKGLFKGKNFIVFGDSITDGCLLDPSAPNTLPNGFNYEDTYFARLCRELETVSDPTDLKNSNLACGGTTLVYGYAQTYGVSGVERVIAEHPIYDAGRERDIPSAIASADLCVIFYGTNDFGYGVPVAADGENGYNDYPARISEVKTYKGGLYFMITQLRLRNPTIKIVVLPMLFRRAGGNLIYSEDRTDVINVDAGIRWSEYCTAAKEVSEMFGAKFIDWSDVFDYENFGTMNKYSADGLHPNVAGHERMFNVLMDRLGGVKE